MAVQSHFLHFALFLYIAHGLIQQNVLIPLFAYNLPRNRWLVHFCTSTPKYLFGLRISNPSYYRSRKVVRDGLELYGSLQKLPLRKDLLDGPSRALAVFSHNVSCGNSYGLSCYNSCVWSRTPSFPRSLSHALLPVPIRINKDNFRRPGNRPSCQYKFAKRVVVVSRPPFLTSAPPCPPLDGFPRDVLFGSRLFCPSNLFHCMAWAHPQV